MLERNEQRRSGIPPIFTQVVEGPGPLRYVITREDGEIFYLIISPKDALIIGSDKIIASRKGPDLNPMLAIDNSGIMVGGIYGEESPQFVFNPSTGQLELIGDGNVICSNETVDGLSDEGEYWFSRAGGFERFGGRIVSFKKIGDNWLFSLVVGTKDTFKMTITDSQIIEGLLSRLQTDIMGLVALLSNPNTPPDLIESVLEGLEITSIDIIPIVMSTLLPKSTDASSIFNFNPEEILATRRKILPFIPTIIKITSEEREEIMRLGQQTEE